MAEGLILLTSSSSDGEASGGPCRARRRRQRQRKRRRRFPQAASVSPARAASGVKMEALPLSARLPPRARRLLGGSAAAGLPGRASRGAAGGFGCGAGGREGLPATPPTAPGFLAAGRAPSDAGKLRRVQARGMAARCAPPAKLAAAGSGLGAGGGWGAARRSGWTASGFLSGRNSRLGRTFPGVGREGDAALP